MKLQKDGNCWMITKNDFVDLETSPAEFIEIHSMTGQLINELTAEKSRAAKAGEFAGTAFVMVLIALLALSVIGAWVKYFVIGWVLSGC